MKDTIKKEYNFLTFNQPDDYEGKVITTLISRQTQKNTKKAFLYLHGFNDYFFQDHMADWANKEGLNFYALELRKYGRSILPNQTPNDFRDYHEYFEDIDTAIKHIKENDNNEKIVFMGHSNGGLISSLYADEGKYKDNINLLILNSPFFEFNIDPILKATFLPLMSALGKSFPKIASPVGLDTGYGYSIHKSHKGEWDYDLKLKPDAGFKIHAGWIRAVRTAQKRLQSGLNIQVPILVMYSKKSVKPGNFKPEMKHSDSVLNVKDIEFYSDKLGPNITKVSFEGGLHDLLLSEKPVREKVLSTMSDFVNKNL